MGRPSATTTAASAFSSATIAACTGSPAPTMGSGGAMCSASRSASWARPVNSASTTWLPSVSLVLLGISGFSGSPICVVKEPPAAPVSPSPSPSPPPHAADRLRAYLGREVTLGIRPEDLRIAAAAEPADFAFDALVEVVEKLGSEILLDLKVGRGAMVAAVEPTVRAVYGDRLRIALNPDRLHFFDAQTDATI